MPDEISLKRSIFRVEVLQREIEERDQATAQVLPDALSPSISSILSLCILSLIYWIALSPVSLHYIAKLTPGASVAGSNTRGQLELISTGLAPIIVGGIGNFDVASSSSQIHATFKVVDSAGNCHKPAGDGGDTRSVSRCVDVIIQSALGPVGLVDAQTFSGVVTARVPLYICVAEVFGSR